MAETSKGMYWTGWVLSVLPCLMLGSGAVNAIFIKSQQVIDGTAHLGYPLSTLTIMGVIELLCVVFYLIPRTAVLGAILMTAYFGGAVASHIRIGESMWFVAVIFGVIVWLGLWLRDTRLRALLPLS
jgi:DoxX-like family